MKNKTGKPNKGIIEDEWTFEEIIHLRTSDVTSEAITALKSASTVWYCSKGKSIVRKNEKCSRWIFISKGLASIVYEKGSKSTTLFIGGASGVFTSFHTYMADQNSIFTLEALTDCHGWEIEHDVYRELVKKYPDLLHFELNFPRTQLYELEVTYDRRALTTPLERYKTFWTHYPETCNTDERYGGTITQFLPLKVIASYLGMTQQTLSKIRRQELESLRNKEQS